MRGKARFRATVSPFAESPKRWFIATVRAKTDLQHLVRGVVCVCVCVCVRERERECIGRY